MTTATQRKPNTPLTKFFSNGEYTKVPVKEQVLRNAEPDLSARMRQRNPDRINEQIDIKTITQSSVDLKSFNPHHYIKPSYLQNRQLNLSLVDQDIKLPLIQESRNLQF
jgi:hypothetical protein